MMKTMSLCTSDRERRLWVWVAVVLVAIYSTLGAMRAAVEFLRAHNLLRVTFTLVLIVVISALVLQWVKKRPRWPEIAVGLGIAAVYLWALARYASAQPK